MLAVVVCSLVSIFVLTGLLAGVAVAVVRARVQIGEALVFEPLAPVRVQPAAVPPRWHPA